MCSGCHRELAPQQASLRLTTSNAAQPTQVDRDTMERYLNVPIQFDMRSEILKATHTLLNFCDDNAIEGSDSVPRELIASAWGLAFVTTMQAGFFFSARVGSGLVIARTPDGGWSAPSAVCTAGAGWGLQIGGEVTDMLVVLNSQDAVDAFASTAQLSLGTELSLALGPMGRSAETNMTAGDGGVSAVFSYAHSKGFFVGIALHAAVILGRPDCNEKFYGEKSDISRILSGGVDRPLGADPLYAALGEVLRGEQPFHAFGDGRGEWAVANGARADDDDEYAFAGADVDVADPFAPPHERVPVSVDARDGRAVVDAFRSADPPLGAVAAVRAEPIAPVDAAEQEQIDHDLALALALSEEEDERARLENERMPPPPPPDAPYRPPPAEEPFFGRWGEPGAADDGWATERRERIASLQDDAPFAVTDELQTMRLSPAASRAAVASYEAPDDDEGDLEV